MDIYTAISTRRTVRDFMDRPVPEAVIEKIISAGLQAPTNDHMRSWEFVLVNDTKERAKLLTFTPLHDEQSINTYLDASGMVDASQRTMYMQAIPRQQAMLYNAGCLILPFFRADKPLLQAQRLNDLNSFASIWCCLENMLLAAAAEGVFGVTRIPMPAELPHIKACVGHPDEYVMPCYLALGYAASDAVMPAQKPVCARSKMHANTW